MGRHHRLAVYLQPSDGEPGGLHPSGAFHAADIVLGLETLALACCHAVNLLENASIASRTGTADRP